MAVFGTINMYARWPQWQREKPSSWSAGNATGVFLVDRKDKNYPNAVDTIWPFFNLCKRA